MKDEGELAMLLGLISMRQAALSSDGAWTNYTDAQRRAALADLEKIQGDILKLDFSGTAAKLTALSLLLDGTDHPNFADDFKNELFENLRRLEKHRAGQRHLP